MKKSVAARTNAQYKFERDRFKQALDDIINPLGALRRKADLNNGRLNEYAHVIANSPGFFQDIAKDALGLGGHIPKPTKEECFAAVETLTERSTDPQIERVLRMLVLAKLRQRIFDEVMDLISANTNLKPKYIRDLVRGKITDEVEMERTLIDMACPES